METDAPAAVPVDEISPTGQVYEDDLAPHEHHHPEPRAYVVVAAILAAATAVEVWVYYLDYVRPYLLPILLTLGFVKFALVAAYFMHLKFDSPTFKRIFVMGIILAITIYTIVLLTFHVFNGGNRL